MFGVGLWELIIVFSIILLLFGGSRLPGVATGLGSAIRNFKSALRDTDDGDVADIADKRSDKEKR